MFPTKTCVICKRDWQPTTRFQLARNQTCGRKCSARLIGMKHAALPPKVRPSFPCGTCGALVHRPPSHRARVAVIYCSHSCRSKTFADRLRPMAGNMKGRKREPQYGEKNPAWKGG